MKLVNIADLKSAASRLAGSSPVPGTRFASFFARTRDDACGGYFALLMKRAAGAATARARECARRNAVPTPRHAPSPPRRSQRVRDRRSFRRSRWRASIRGAVARRAAPRACAPRSPRRTHPPVRRPAATSATCRARAPNRLLRCPFAWRQPPSRTHSLIVLPCRPAQQAACSSREAGTGAHRPRRVIKHRRTFTSRSDARAASGIDRLTR